MRSIDQLTAELLALPSLSRSVIAEMLVESLEFDTDPKIYAAWTAEAKKRLNEIRNGSIRTIAGEEALAQVRQLLE
ncbi:addiction module protein [Fortiea contorta]|uniref:addiction module protein n=1 Tax=Fortiea contorta TaxID=1892405 RepID=UPI00037420B2|nr:addiction module protein [Fortiea contorta]